MGEPKDVPAETESRAEGGAAAGVSESVRVSATVAVGPDGQTRAVPERIARRVWVAAGARCSAASASA